MPQDRLHKLLAQAGVASRRACETLIRDGRVTVNGQPATPGMSVDPAADVVRVDGEVIALAQPRLVYIMLNKPAGVVSAAHAQRQEKRPTVLDLVRVAERVYPVGRLDADSEGLVLLTNDGSLTQRLTHARYGHQKVYRVLVEGTPTPEQIETWAGGVILDDGPTAPCQVSISKRLDNSTWLEVIMGEGRKRQIRRTAAAVGLRVLRLIRTRIGPLRLSGVEPGAWRYLTEEEVAALQRPAAPTRPVQRSASREAGTPTPERPRRFRRSAGQEPAGGKAQTGSRKQRRGKARPATQPSDWENRPAQPKRPASPGQSTGGEQPPADRPRRPRRQGQPGGREQSGGRRRPRQPGSGGQRPAGNRPDRRGGRGGQPARKGRKD